MKTSLIIAFGTLIGFGLGMLVGFVSCKSVMTPTVITNPTPAPILASTTHLDRSYDGCLVRVKIGDDITVTFNENPAKNGKWTQVSITQTPKTPFIKNEPFMFLTDESKRTNSDTNQDRKFTYHVNAEGTAILQFEYKEGDVTIDTVGFYIVAK